MGGLLAARRLRTLVTVRPHPDTSECDALVVDTESRNTEPEAAAERVNAAVRAIAKFGSCPTFKKVDSTLRGPIGAELRALSAALGGRRILLAPAYPQLGRVVRSGRLIVGGVEVDRTQFAHDPRWPVSDARVAHAIGLTEPDPLIHVCDAESDEDLRALAATAAPDVVLAGSGGLGRVWADGLPPGAAVLESVSPPQRPLLVCGSRHPVSRAQAMHAAATGLPVILPPDETANSQAVLTQVTVSAAGSIEARQPDMLILFGGETAAAVLSHIGIMDLWPVCEVAAGIVASRAKHADREMMVVTKAGGFGTPSVVEDILRKWQ